MIQLLHVLFVARQCRANNGNTSFFIQGKRKILGKNFIAADII